MTPEFLDGPISRDYREILESAPFLNASPKPKAGTGGTKCKSTIPKVCPKPETGGTQCKSEVPVCPKPDTTGKACKSMPKVCKKAETGGTQCKSESPNCPRKKADAALLDVPGWSSPPAPLF